VTTRNGQNDPRITSLEEARRRKAEKEKAADQAARQCASGGSLKSRIFGLAMIAMAAGFVFWLLGGLGGTTAPSGEGQ